jgi:hypothetical protein
MGPKYETGHAVNLAHFQEMISICESYGNKFRPSHPSLAIPAMKGTLTEGEKMQKIFDEIEAWAKTPINNRQILFAALDPLVIRTQNSYEGTKTSVLNMKTARSYVNKITGNNVRIPKLPDGSPKPGHISNSHQGFDMRLNTFEQLIFFYEADEFYAPNEPELTIASLKALLDTMQKANSAAIIADAEVAIAMVNRDDVLYAIPAGLVETAYRCKKYVCGVFGPRSPEAKMVTKIKFRRKVNQKKAGRNKKHAKK